MGNETSLFMHDLDKPLIPVFSRVPDIPSAFYPFMTNLLTHLYNSVLGAEDIAVAYGGQMANKIAYPTNPEVRLNPDKY